jgi:D-galactarolactone cycloisomerase
MKMKVGYDVASDAESVKAVRDAIGDDPALMIDANEAFDAPAAIELGRRVADHNIGWFEEPVPPDDIAGYRAIKAALPMPIASGEAEFSRFGFRDIVAGRVVDIIQPDICGAGGFSETKKIVDMAHAFGLRCHPHTWGTAIAIAASLQLLAVVPDSVTAVTKVPPYLEMDCMEHPIRDALLPDEMRPRNGVVRIPDRPGLGLEVDREALARFRIA